MITLCIRYYFSSASASLTLTSHTCSSVLLGLQSASYICYLSRPHLKPSCAPVTSCPRTSLLTRAWDSRENCLTPEHMQPRSASSEPSNGQNLILSSALSESVFARAAITKHHRLSGWNKRTSLSQFWRTEVQTQGVCRVSSCRGLSPWLVDAILSLYLHTLFLCVSLYPNSSYKNTRNNLD